MDEIVGWLLFQTGGSFVLGRGAPVRATTTAVGEEVALLPALGLGLGTAVGSTPDDGFGGVTNHGAMLCHEGEGASRAEGESVGKLLGTGYGARFGSGFQGPGFCLPGKCFGSSGSGFHGSGFHGSGFHGSGFHGSGFHGSGFSLLG